MGYVEASKTINASVYAVWNTLNDIDNTPKWVVGLERAEVKTEGTYGINTVYNDYNRLGPFLQVTAWHIVEFESVTRQVHLSDSRTLPSLMTLRLSPEGDSAFLKMTVEYRFMPRWGAISELFERLVMNHLLKSVLGQNLNHLDRYLQSEIVRVRSTQEMWWVR